MPLGAFLRFLAILYDFLGFVFDFWSKKLCDDLYRVTMLKGGENFAGLHFTSVCFVFFFIFWDFGGFGIPNGAFWRPVFDEI